ncbi:MAG: NUDIX family [Verrucomicrobia bacterium]|nr:MAG: NUDIX family [Verrucomicrobiota bacterium]
MAEEMILVVPRAEFDRLGAFQGLHFEVDRYLSELLTPPSPRFMARSLAETDPKFKQIIPYAIFTHEGRILSYVRGGKGGEKRLAAKRSIGIGGHMNDGDAAGEAFDLAAYHRALQREIAEELQINSPYSQRAVALLNDDSTDVGKVHMGVVHIFECETDAINCGEAVITDLAFLDKETLQENHEHLETWSQICLAEIGRLLGS